MLHNTVDTRHGETEFIGGIAETNNAFVFFNLLISSGKYSIIIGERIQDDIQVI
jgi:hypothetical protein